MTGDRPQAAGWGVGAEFVDTAPPMVYEDPGGRIVDGFPGVAACGKTWNVNRRFSNPLSLNLKSLRVRP